jgi:TniQ
MIPNTPWLRTVQQFDDEAIASVAVRLAPMGRIDVDRLLRLHLDMDKLSVSAIASRPAAIAELAALGSFDLQRLSMGTARVFKDHAEFLGRQLPVGWFLPERRRVAPARLAADGENARIRNVWLLSAMPCDIETGEALLNRCPSCLALLGWRKISNVWSCQVCEFDLRTAVPRSCAPQAVEAAGELARYIFHRGLRLPPPLGELPSLDLLKLSGWLAHFRAIPQELFLGITAKNAAMGFSQLKRWPSTFDEIVFVLLGASTPDDLAVGDPISRYTAAAGLMTSIDRLPSSKARDIVKGRLMELLGLDHGFTEAFRKVTEPVLPLGIAISGLDRRRSSKLARARIERGLALPD